MGDKIFDFIVVGSGPSGISAALALLSEGRRVALIDPGLSIDAESATFAKSLATKDPSQWTKSDWKSLSSSLLNRRDKIPEKRVLGSDYSTRQIAPVTGSSSSPKFGLTGSFAVGGLSNIWGAALLRLRHEDVRTWPIDYTDLEAGYSAIESVLPVSGIDDSLSRAYPAKISYQLRLSPQSRWLLENLSKSGFDAKSHLFGAARLAINNNCQHCNGCMNGCVYDAIFSSRHLLGQSVSEGMEHLSGWIVDAFKEERDTVKLMLRRPNYLDIMTIEARRVVLACGTLNSSHLILKSIPERLQSVTLCDSQHFIFPIWLSGFSQRLDMKIRTHSLAQIFVEIEDAYISRHSIHLQLYSYMMAFANQIRTVLRLPGVVDPIVHRLAWKMMVVQGYLHSADSSVAELRLNEASGLLDTKVVRSNRIAPLIQRIQDNMRQLGRKAGFRVLPVGLDIGPFGRGFHVGATFPMHSQGANPATSDILGRPAGLKRVHLVDASILPEIPSTAITLTVMANAYRIGKQIAKFN